MFFTMKRLVHGIINTHVSLCHHAIISSCSLGSSRDTGGVIASDCQKVLERDKCHNQPQPNIAK
jgi:hypothetical protein